MSTTPPISSDVEDGDPSQGTENSNQSQASDGSASSRDAKVWRDLEAETGFRTYTEYLEQYTQTRPQYLELLGSLKESSSATKPNIVSIYDIQQHDSFPTSFNLRARCASGTKFLEILPQCPSNACAQLVIWPAIWGHRPLINHEMLDAVGLSLQVDPKVFESLILKCNERGDEVIDLLQAWSLKCQSLSGKYITATITRQPLADREDPIKPVVLIVSESQNTFGNLLLDDSINRGLRNPKPYRPQSVGEFDITDHEALRWAHHYVAIANHYLEPFKDSIKSDATAILLSLLPLLYSSAEQIRRQINVFRAMYENLVRYICIPPTVGRWSGPIPANTETIDMHRMTLRGAVESFDRLRNNVSAAASLDLGSSSAEESQHKRLSAVYDPLVAEARRLESEVKDHLQLEAGRLAVEESRNSIKLTNMQIQEARRGERVVVIDVI